jgi:hypothetical protein
MICFIDEINERNQLRIGNRRVAIGPVVQDGKRHGKTHCNLRATKARDDELQQTRASAFLHGGRIVRWPGLRARAERSPMDKLAFYLSGRKEKARIGIRLVSGLGLNFQRRR